MQTVRRLVRSLAVPTALALLPSTALAKAPPPKPAAEANEAKEHYLAGRKLFDLTRYDDAIAEFEKAYEAKEDPVFLYNIAQAHRLAGHLDKAARFYRNYLRLQPDSPQRAEIERRIAEIEQAMRTQQSQQVLPPMGTLGPGEKPSSSETGEPSATQPAQPQPAQTPPAAPQQTSPASTEPAATSSNGRVLKIAGIAVAVVGVALIGVGLGVGLDALGAQSDYAHPKPGTVYDPGLDQRANVNGGIGIGIGAAGVVAAAAGVVLLVKGLREGAPQGPHALLVPTVTPHQAGAALSLSF